MIRVNILVDLNPRRLRAECCDFTAQGAQAFVELEKEQELARQLAVEWGQLQLEQSTWAMHTRVEKIATGQLHMRLPDASRVQIVPSDGFLSIQPISMEAPEP